ncbi:MAG: V-type ATP synthase subunit F [Verrucomicrobiota bacterium]
MKFYCIADEDTVRGLRLAGVAGQVVTSPEEAIVAFNAAVAVRANGIIILTQNVMAGIRAQIEAHRLEREQPLIVEIPGPTGPLAGHQSLRQIAQAAVGISVGENDGDF